MENGKKGEGRGNCYRTKELLVEGVEELITEDGFYVTLLVEGVDKR